MIIKSKPIPFKTSYVFIAAFLLVVVVTVQSSFAASNGENGIVLDSLVFYLINYNLFAGLIHFCYGIIIHFNKPKSLRKSIIYPLIQALSIIGLHLLVSNVLYYLAKTLYEPVSISSFLETLSFHLGSAFFSRLLDLMVILLMLKIIDGYRTLELRKLEVLELKNELNLTELAALKSQLNPHFLFNALHAVHSLIGYEDERAKKMVIKISSLLRKMLEQNNQSLIPFKEELSYVLDYIEIEKERFHDRLILEINVNNETLPHLVPTLFLQPMIENAFKHGISQVEGSGLIHLSAELNEDRLIIIMKNSIPKIHNTVPRPSMNIGLNNLKARLSKLDPNHKISLESSSDLFEIKIDLSGNLRL